MTPNQPPTIPDRTSSAEGSANNAAVTVDAGLVAPLLGLAPDAFMAAIRNGAISQVTELGIDEDAGHYRVTFRYRRRRCRVVVRAETGAAVLA